jgi:hypothetical protein
MDIPPLKRKLDVDLSELELAFENASWEINFYLDLENGKVVTIQENTFHDLEEIYTEYGEDEEGNEQEFDLAEVLDGIDLHDWEREVLSNADQVNQGLGNRFIRVPNADSRLGFEDMVDFSETVINPALKRQMSQALRGRSPFRRFKDVLQNYPKERERWFAFKRECTHGRIYDWLEKVGIEISSD